MFGAVTITADHVFDRGNLTASTTGTAGQPTIAATLDVSGILDVSVTQNLNLTVNAFICEPSGVTTIGLSKLTSTGSFTNQGQITMAGGQIVANQGLTNSGTITTSAVGGGITGNVNNAGSIQWTGALHGLTIFGDYTGLGSVNMRINGTVRGACDVLTVTGTATVTNGILNVTNIGNAVVFPRSWNLLNAGTLVGPFGTASLPPGLSQIIIGNGLFI
jgi:hypothetical protein